MKMQNLNKETYIILAGIRYQVQVMDGQVSFINKELSFTQMAFERRQDINKSPGIWYMVYFEADRDCIPACHIVEAIKYLEQEFGKDFEKYKGELSYLNNLHEIII